MPEPPDMCSDETWADFVFNRNGAPGTKTEWWCHTPSNNWFLAVRDTEARSTSADAPGCPETRNDAPARRPTSGWTAAGAVQFSFEGRRFEGLAGDSSPAPCGPRASAGSAAASSTTARAACCRPPTTTPTSCCRTASA